MHYNELRGHSIKVYIPTSKEAISSNWLVYSGKKKIQN